MNSIYTLEDVRYLFENEATLKMEADKFLIDITRSIDMDIYLREMYHVFEYILITGDLRYVDTILIPMIHRIYNSQIKPKTIYKVLYGGRSPITEYGWKIAGEEYLRSNRGAFPTTIKRDRVLINGVYPDIDSTALSTILLSKVYRSMENRLKGDFLQAIEDAVDYILRRDVNNDGLIEQSPNEDWAVGACREGNVTYTNLLAFLALEEVYDLFLSIGHDEYRKRVENRLTKMTDALIDRLWIRDYFVNGIDGFGKYNLTYALDTIYIDQSIMLNSEKKIDIHIKTLADKLLKNGLLISFYPVPYNECVVKMEPYTYINGGVWPRLNIFFARSLIRRGYITEAAKLLKNVLNIRKYRWIKPDEPTKHKEDTYRENIFLILISLKELRGKLESIE
jgi:hypothetical protein